jgi:hypothetical protein
MNDDASSMSLVASIFPFLFWCVKINTRINSRSQVSTHTPFLHNRVLEVACVSRTLRRTTSSSILNLFQPLPLPLEKHVLVDYDHDPSSLPFPSLPFPQAVSIKTQLSFYTFVTWLIKQKRDLSLSLQHGPFLIKYFHVFCINTLLS